jgi:hypothetical protein
MVQVILNQPAQLLMPGLGRRIHPRSAAKPYLIGHSDKKTSRDFIHRVAPGPMLGADDESGQSDEVVHRPYFAFHIAQKISQQASGGHNEKANLRALGDVETALTARKRHIRY